MGKSDCLLGNPPLAEIVKDLLIRSKKVHSFFFIRIKSIRILRLKIAKI